MASRRPGFTTRGSCLLAAGITAVLCGLALGTADLVRAGLLAVVLPLIAAVLVHRSTLRFTERRRADPATSSAGQPVQIHLQLSNQSRLPTASLMLEDQLPAAAGERARFVLDALSSREQRVITYRMPDLPRGRYRAGPLRAKLTDPFHLVEVVRAFDATSSFVVTPIVDSLDGAEPPRSYDVGENAGSHSVGTHGADDASTREYRTGDDLRKIHWRSTARTGALMVRQEERPWQGQVSVLLDTRTIAHASRPAVRPGGDVRNDNSLEWAISAAASIGTRLLQANREVGLMSDPSWPERHDFTDQRRLAEYLGVVRPSPVPDLSALASVLRAAGRDSALVAIVGRLDPPSLEVLAGARPRGSAIPAFAIVVDADSWLPKSSDDDPGHLAVDANEVLRAAGWRTVVVQRGDTTAGAWRQLLRSTQEVSLSGLVTTR